MKKLLQYTIVFIFSFVNVYPQWIEQNPFANGTELLGVEFISSTVGWTIGNSGTIFRTTDGGTTWTSQSSGTTNHLHSVFFTNANNGTAVGNSGTILRTTNSGITWIQQSSGTTNRLKDVFFSDVNNGTATGQNGIILRTTNGGTSWISQTSGTTQMLYGVSFTDANNGTVVGEGGIILRTTNGGTIWISQTSGTTRSLIDVCFTDSITGMAVGYEGTILRTTDGGTTWMQQSSGIGNWTLFGVSFIDTNTVTAVGDGGIILRTIDGGATWSEQSNPTVIILWDVSFTDSDNGIAVGQNGIVLKTTDGGTTWTSKKSGDLSDLFGVSFVDANIGMAVGYEYYPCAGIMRTTNGGISWYQLPYFVNSGSNFSSVSFTDPYNGTVLNNWNRIFRTTDGGENWVQQTSGTENYLWDVSFTDVDNGMVVGDEGTILRTTNGGTDWTPQSSGTTNHLYGVSFTDVDNGTVVGDEGTILRTTDGGTTWTSQTSGTLSNLRTISFNDANNGTAVGDGGIILRTTNGGTAWTLQTSGTTNNLYGVSFTDINNGTAVGDGGVILRTVNGGTVWTSQSSGITKNLRGVCFTDAKNGTAVGEYGTILRTRNGGFAPLPPAWSNQISTINEGGIESSEILTFGQDPNATDSIDLSLGEYELPPPPPPGIFDSRFVLPTNPEMGSLKDYRDSTLTEITWKLTFQPGIAGYPMTFSWDSTSFPEGTFYLKDWINGSYVFVNMKNQSNYMLTDSVITSLRIIFYKDGTIPIAPLPPTNLSGIADTSSIELSWLDNSDNETGFVIERKDGDSLGVNPFVIIDTVAVNDIFYIDSGLIPDTTYTYRVSAFNEFGSSNYSNIVQITTLSLQVTFQLTVSVLDGWNMVSIPGLHPVNQEVTTWWSNLTGNVFKFSGGYVSVTTAATGEGYWMKNLGDQTYSTGDEWPASGIIITTHDTINCLEGWNMIGGYEYNVTVSGITTIPPGLQQSPVYEYSEGYQMVDFLIPGYGYWIKLSADGQIVFPDVLGKSNEITKLIKDDWGKITITDNTGRSYTLYIVKGGVNLNSYELPPMPPAGMFDIRFGSGRIAEDIESSIQSIDMTGIEHPIRVKVENMDIRLQDATGKELNENLKSGEEVTISNASINKLMVSTELIPDTYVLYQNYPNPFNPATTIKFAVPKESQVNLNIYNMLGELVSTLVNEQKKPGYYEYKFDASNLASGVYFFRIKAGDFVETKKMLLLK